MLVIRLDTMWLRQKVSFRLVKIIYLGMQYKILQPLTPSSDVDIFIYLFIYLFSYLLSILRVTQRAKPVQGVPH